MPPNCDDPRLPDPPVVHILIVTETGITFDDDRNKDFALGHFCRLLENTKSPLLSYKVTTAHRGDDTCATHSQFRFDDKHKFPSDYDEVWLFGIGLESDSSKLEETEIAAIYRFMNSGKGLFATGDHEDLGYSLCGNIPRVRRMRKWRKCETPDRNNGERHDSLRKTFKAGVGGTYSPDSEEDCRTQVIVAQLYANPPVLGEPATAYPHEVLSTPEGPIKFLPDHMHEGQCVGLDDPSNYDPPYEGEFPLNSDGTRELPKIIAYSQTPESHLSYDPRVDAYHPPTEVACFACIGAYDGQKVRNVINGVQSNTGRVVVDSSFHHFLNMNLRGFISSDDRKCKKRYKQIKAYYGKLARWLAPKSLDVEMRSRAFWIARWSYPVIEELLHLDPAADLGKMYFGGDTNYVLRLGVMTQGALGNIASPATALQWSLNIIQNNKPAEFKMSWIDPWADSPDTPLESAFNHEHIIYAVLGGIMIAIALRFDDTEPPFNKDVLKAVDESIVIGITLGLFAYEAHLAKISSQLTDTHKSLRKFLGIG